MADIFVSYTSTDRDWAFWIAKELEAQDHTPHIHEWEVKGGDDIFAWMQQRHDAADHVLCVVSDDYLKAPYSTLERNAALWQAASSRPGFVLLVAVKPCKLPTLSDHIRRCELFGVPEEAARVRFGEFMSTREARSTIAFPGQVFAASNIPIRVPTHFMGREDAFAAIATALHRYEGRVAITAVHGLRGVGKSTLAATYAERHRGDYRATWWIRAQSEAGLRADLAALGVRLGWVVPDAKEEPALAAVMERLRHEGEGILLIFDNAIDAAALKPFLPHGGRAHVLVTSNAHAWRGIADPIELRLWPRDIGADYLIARTGQTGEREAALALSEALGGLPLAHEQAAAYCERLDLSLAEYRKRFETAPARLLDDERHAPVEYHDGLTVAKTFALAIEEAAKLHPAAEPLIVQAALLAPEPIPLFLFAEAREKLGEPLATALAGDGLDEAVAALRTFALIDRETIPDEREAAITTDCIRLHRLVRQVATSRCDGPVINATRCALIKGVAEVFPRNPFGDPNGWPRARRLDTIARALAGSEAPEGAEDRSADLLDSLGQFSQALGAYAQARPLFERALAINEKVRGPEHPDTATSSNNLAHLLWVQGENAAARSLYERAAAIYEKVLGPKHPKTARSLSNLAIVIQDQGDFAGARPLYERALAICEEVLGPEHPETILPLHNLAFLLWCQGDLAAARPLYERALASREKVLGPEHPHTALSLHNLGTLLQDQGDLAGAQALNERALATREKVLGPEHPDTAQSLNNLASLLTRIGRASEAEPLFLRAIGIAQNALGPGHSRTQRYRSCYARLLLETGRSAEAVAFAEAALAILAVMPGPNHPWTKDAAHVTADAFAARGRIDEAAVLRGRYGLRDSAE